MGIPADTVIVFTFVLGSGFAGLAGLFFAMGLAPLLMYEMFRTLKRLNEEGLTILLIEQNAKVALSFAHRGYVLDTGEIKVAGTAEELRNDPEVKRAYLGG